MQIAYQRGLVAGALKHKRPDRLGAMLAVGTSPKIIAPLISKIGSDLVVVACINGPSLVTISGDAEAVVRLQKEAEGQGWFNRLLKVDVAYHSPHMREVAQDYFNVIKSIEAQNSTDIAFHSSVKGCRLESAGMNAQYWVDNLTSPVQLVDGFTSMYSGDLKPDLVIEIGPHSALEAPIKDILKHNIAKHDPSRSSKAVYLPTLVRNTDADISMFSLAASLHIAGFEIDLLKVNWVESDNRPSPLVNLPSYAWNHKKHWYETRLCLNHRIKTFARSDILGSLVDDFNDEEPQWRNVMRLSEIPWIADHNVQGSVLLPFTRYLATVIEAAQQHAILQGSPVAPATIYKLREIRVSRPMIISDSSLVETSLILRPREQGSRAKSKTWNDFSIYSWTTANGWTEHCYGLIGLSRDEQAIGGLNEKRHLIYRQKELAKLMDEHEELCIQKLDPAAIYKRFSKGGIFFGDMFRNIATARTATDRSICEIRVADTARSMPCGHESAYSFHPTAFDACFQALGCIITEEDTFVPTFVKEIDLHHALLPNQPGQQFEVFASRERPFGEMDTNIHASFLARTQGKDGGVFLEVRGFDGAVLPNNNIDENQTGPRGLCYQILFEPSMDLMTSVQFNEYFGITEVTAAGMQQARDLERAAFYNIQESTDSPDEERDDAYDGHLGKLRRVLLGFLEQGNQGRLPLQTPEWLACSETQRQEFLTQFASQDACGRLLCSLGNGYRAIVEEEVEPLPIMLRDDMLESFYREAEITKQGYDAIHKILRNMAHQYPGMRILEIGTGTGAATMPSLNALGQNFDSYVFTDILSGFFPRAKEEQKKWGDKMQYKKLHIEQDPIAQGFERESCDLIIAANVIHATANVSNIMRNLRTLLKPGGKALIFEVTEQLLSTAFIFGTLPGWWLGEEPHRQNGPLLNEATWNTLLEQSGFSGLDGSLDTFPGLPNTIRLMISTAVHEKPSDCPVAKVLFCDPSALSLARKLCDVLPKSEEAVYEPHNLLEADMQDQFGIVLALEDSFWLHIDAKSLDHMKILLTSASGMFWVTNGARSKSPSADMITGLMRSLRNENAGTRLARLDLDGKAGPQNPTIIEKIMTTFTSLFGSSKHSNMTDVEFLVMDGLIQVPRIYPDESKDRFVERETRPLVPEAQPFYQKGRPLKLKLGQPGLLDSIHFVEDESQYTDLNANDVEISTRATSLNFKDVMIALGQLPPYHELGLECSGVVTAVGSNVTSLAKGDCVCGIAKGAYANAVRVSQDLVTKLPPTADFIEAASIPVVYCTAKYALDEIARITKGETVLIHAAAGGVGQAAIALAQMAEAEVFATVGTEEKKTFLREQYGIPDDHIFSSRDLSFQQELMHVTKQRGVDVVLNSTAGEILHQSWQCLAPFGRFVEIGKRDLVENSNLEMGKFQESVIFSAVDLGLLTEKKPQLYQRLLKKVVGQYLSGEIKPVHPITVFSISEVSQAMRMMQSGKHMGKVVIEAKQDSIVQALPAPTPNLFRDQDASYLITGGTGGLGRSIIRWLAEQGAKNIIAVSRSGMKQKGVAALHDQLNEMRVNLVVKVCDVGDKDQLQALVAKCSKTLPPIKGVIHGAMALQDSLFEKISHEVWTMNTRPRVTGAWNLHHSLADKKLDFFIMLASGSGIVGYPGQAAYAASNTFLDSFAAYRNHLNLPASVIDIGLVKDIGYVSENPQRQAEIAEVMQDRLTEAEVLSLLKGHISNAEAFRGPDRAQTLTGYKISADKTLPKWAADPRFEHLLPQTNTAPSAQIARGSAMRALIKQAESLERVYELITQSLRDNLSSLLMIAGEDVDVKKPIVAYGLDSLVAVELRNSISRDLDANVPLMELMGAPSIEKLVERIARKSKVVDQTLLVGDGGEGENVVVAEASTG